MPEAVQRVTKDPDAGEAVAEIADRAAKGENRKPGGTGI